MSSRIADRRDVRTHRIPRSLLRSLAAGDADESGILRGGQVSKRRLLLYAVQHRIAVSHPDLFDAGDFAANWSALVGAFRASPTAVERTLLYPSVGAWGMRLLQRLQEPTALTEADIDDAGYLGGVIAVALFRAGSPGQVRVRARADGTVTLPGFGRFDALEGSRWLTATIRPEPSSVHLLDEGSLVAAATEGPRWSPVRRTRSTSFGQRFEVVLDDLDPFRAPDRLPTDDRLTDEAVDQWQQQIDVAWSVLTQRHPRRATALSRDIAVLAPLRATEGEPEVSASSGDSFGGVALTKPHSGVRLAEALIHEHQHIKLWALFSLLPLVDLLDERPYYAPWRTDPRPARGLLQGAYAYLGLVSFWEIERHRENGAPGRVAHFEFARWRTAVSHVLETLVQSGALTEAGLEFVAGMQRTLTPLLLVPVPTLPAELADEAEAENKIGWRLRNLSVDAATLRALARAWREGLPPPPVADRSAEPRAGRRESWSTGRQRIARDRLEGRVTPTPLHDHAAPADVAYARGDHAAAAALYAEAIRSTTASVDAWIGLALVHRQLKSRAGFALTDRPELVRALWTSIGPDDAPRSPVELAEWVSAGLDGRRLDH